AEDGIRDFHVTGVQTCALPILSESEKGTTKDGMKETKQEKYDRAYLRMATEWGKLSYCKRKQVGAIIVKDRMIISDGYNGTPTRSEEHTSELQSRENLVCRLLL